MKRTFAFTVAAALAGMLAFSGGAFAARPPDAGSGGGGGGGGSDGGSEPPDYGDLVILYRTAWGVPFLTGETELPNPDTEVGGMVPAGLCQQPIAFNVSDAVDTVCPTTCAAVDSVPPGATVVAVDQVTCAVLAACAGCTQEVDFGRMSVARSSDTVFESQLEDVVVNLGTADCVTLDAAGRLVVTTVADDGTPSEAAIDSPLQNLAIYKQLMAAGYLGADSGIPLPDDVLNTAARGLGAASAKTGEVNVDLVVYLNEILGLSEPGVATAPELGDLICQENREEVKGAVVLVNKCFLNYEAYTYDRQVNFEGGGDGELPLPWPPFIPKPPNAVPGWFEYLAVNDPDVPLFEIAQGPILDAVFSNSTVVANNIGGLAQAADDARAVINYMHNWPVPNPDVYATKLTCAASLGIHFDLSISEQSGLQVPVNYVNGSAREFTVTVANGGPDPAGGTVTVTATANGGPWSWTFDLGILPAGQSKAFIQPFTIRTTSATIAWTATVVASGPGTDPVLENNTRTATSTVKAKGGGGRR